MTPSKMLFYLCISFVVGIFLQSIIKIPQMFLWGFLIFGVLIIFLSFLLKNNNTIIFSFCVLVLVLGIMRFQISKFNIENDAISKFNNKPEKITLTGQIIAEPDIRDTSQKLKVRIDGADSIVLVTVQRHPEYHYLDKIKILGKLKTPGIFDNFNYKNYLMKDGIYSVMDFPKTELALSERHYKLLSFLYEKILFLKEKLTRALDMNFSSPNSDIMQGIVFGNDKNMQKDLKGKFNATGLSHVTAVSGSNIVILISILMIFLLALGFWRGQAFYFAVLLIWLYIVLIGFPVSGIRAAIMGSAALLGEKLGRQNTSVRALVITASIMLLQNPLLLFYDISFQLSFLASLGIMYVKPIIDIFPTFTPFANRQTGSDGLKITSKNKFKFLFDILSTTFAAQVFTFPIMVYNFGTVSLIAPVTNILILPIIPILTILGFLVSVGGMFSNLLGFIISLPCLLLLSYFVKVLDIFSQPWAVKTIQNISWIWPVLYYLTLSILIWYFNKSKKLKFLGY